MFRLANENHVIILYASSKLIHEQTADELRVKVKIKND